MAQIAEKEARALLKHLASDPHLRIASKSIVPYFEQYPHTWDHQLKNVRNTESSLKHALRISNVLELVIPRVGILLKIRYNGFAGHTQMGV